MLLKKTYNDFEILSKHATFAALFNFTKVGKFSQYKVQLASLSDGKHEENFKVDTQFFKNMENFDVLSSDVDVHMDLVKANDAYDITFTLTGKMELPCDRCLDPLDHEVATSYHIVVKYGEDYDDVSDELLVIPYSDSWLNVAYMLYDTLLLTIPMRKVHPLGKCNRAMSAVLHKHGAADDTEVDFDDEIDTDSIPDEVSEDN